MIPVRDDNPISRTPVVNYLLLATNLLVWLWQYSLMVRGAAWVIPGYGMVPTRLLTDPPGEAFTLLTSMFMHGDWGHLAGNLLFLYVFGDNVEDALGRGRYLAFYVVCGLLAAVAQLLVNPGSPVPMVGASGAIAGVLGAYLVLFPRAPVLVFFGFFFLVFPAWLVVGEWFLWNLLRGVGSLGSGMSGGVAFFAHLGGFAAGLLMVRPWMGSRTRRLGARWSGFKAPERPAWSRRPRD